MTLTGAVVCTPITAGASGRARFMDDFGAVIATAMVVLFWWCREVVFVMVFSMSLEFAIVGEILAGYHVQIECYSPVDDSMDSVEYAKGK